MGRFIAQFTNKLYLFFTTLYEAQNFSWTEDCNSFLDAIKGCLTKPPILSGIKEGKELYMCLAISDYVVNVVLF